MNFKSKVLFSVIVLLMTATHILNAKSAAPGKEQGNVTFVDKSDQKKVDVMMDGKLFTSYMWPDNVMKPVLYPVVTASGAEITRGYPVSPRAGERVDHPHHVGIWFNYGDINKLDFWNNSEAISPASKSGYGTIHHKTIEKKDGGKGHGLLVVTASWDSPDGKQLLAEKTELHFINQGSTRIIDRITTLTAGSTPVSMADNKEGVYAIRVARQLELPSKDEVIMTDAKGIPTTVKAMSTEGVTGSYRSSEGIKDDAVWATRGRWMDLNGTINNEKVAVVICDHPQNVGYPTYWHARGYGLYAANPLGWSVFTKGKETLNYSVPAGKSVTFRYRMVIHNGSDLSDEAINALADEFAKKY
ncbi:MAG TPA: PmoA family protein [Prolixibacteraceae bacterium]|nr:PmoA family protein [Prolixibacteraceae bacterium]